MTIYQRCVILLLTFCLNGIYAQTTRNARIWTRMLTEYDQNNDGLISRTEWKGRLDFEIIDADGDGKMSQSEFFSYLISEFGIGGYFFSEVIASVDTDANRVVTRAEWESVQPHFADRQTGVLLTFEIFDTNHDNLITVHDFRGEQLPDDQDETECPATCAQDADCALCPDGRIKCLSNTCQRPVDPCPAACANDYECARCPDGRTKCDGGICVHQPDPCPAACANDYECARCPDGRTKCSNGVCVRQPDPCPPSCTTNADCARCPDGRTTCSKNGECVSAEQ